MLKAAYNKNSAFPLYDRQSLICSDLAAPPGKSEDRAAWLRLANARKVLGENDRAVEAYARADAIAALPTTQLADWAEAHVRLIKPGAAPAPEAAAVLERLEKAEPRNALALFYLGAAAFAQGDKLAAARRWKTLLALLPADPRDAGTAASVTLLKGAYWPAALANNSAYL